MIFEGHTITYQIKIVEILVFDIFNQNKPLNL